jgi:hypothetical protein
MSYAIHNFVTKASLVSFMDFFSRIEVERLGSAHTSAGELVYVPRKIIQVPIQWCSRDKWFEIYNSSSARKAMDPAIREKNPVEVQWILPRICVYMNGIMYDPARKLGKTQTINDFPGDTPLDRTRQYAPSPYNLDVEVAVVSKTLDDNLQIMEQILPYFSPEMSINVNLVPGQTSSSIPIVMNGILTDIPMDLNENDERFFTFTYNFSIKTNFYPRKKYQTNLIPYTGSYSAVSNIINISSTGAGIVPGMAVFGDGIGPNTFVLSYNGSGGVVISTNTSASGSNVTVSFGTNRATTHVTTHLGMGKDYVQIDQEWLAQLQKIEERFTEYEANAQNPNPFV